MYSILTHHDVKTLEVDGMVENIKSLDISTTEDDFFIKKQNKLNFASKITFSEVLIF